MSKKKQLKKHPKPVPFSKEVYDKLFEEDPVAANMMLLFSELADKKGRVAFEKGNEPGNSSEEQIRHLMNARFNDPKAYQFGK